MTLNRLCLEMHIFLKGQKFKSVLAMRAPTIYFYRLRSLKRNFLKYICIYFFKTLTLLKNCTESCIWISITAFRLCQCPPVIGCGKICQNSIFHLRLSEQFSGSQTAFRTIFIATGGYLKLEHAPWRGFQKDLEILKGTQEWD